MITKLESGTYTLVETHNHTKILTINGTIFAWVRPKGVGDILVKSSYAPHRNNFSLSLGKYNLYSVKDERNLTDLQHLELEVGNNTWQGYLLLTGLPTATKRRARIVPTTQTITSDSHARTQKKTANHIVKQATRP